LLIAASVPTVTIPQSSPRQRDRSIAIGSSFTWRIVGGPDDAYELHRYCVGGRKVQKSEDIDANSSTSTGI
jgi:hypothetical protein